MRETSWTRVSERRQGCPRASTLPLQQLYVHPSQSVVLLSTAQNEHAGTEIRVGDPIRLGSRTRLPPRRAEEA